MNPFVTELRRSPMRWFLPVMLIVQCGTIFYPATYWQGIWSETGMVIQRGSLQLALLVAAGAAIASSRPAREGTVTLVVSSPRPSVHSECLRFAATTVYAVAAPIVGMTVAWSVSLYHAGPGVPWFSYVFVGLAVVVGSAAVGHLVGRLIPHPVVGPLSATATVAAVAIWDGSTNLRSVMVTLNGSPMYEVPAGSVFVRLALVSALVAAALCWRRSRSRSALVVNGAAAVTVVMLLSMVTVSPLRSARPAPENPLCSDTVPRVCIWPENEVFLPEVSVMAVRAARLAPDVLNVPDVFWERGVNPDEPPLMDVYGENALPQGDFELYFHHFLVAVGMSHAIMAETVPCDGGTALAGYDERYAEVTAWMSAKIYDGRQPPDVRGGPAVNWDDVLNRTRQPQPVQEKWLIGEITALKEMCGSSA